MFPIFIINFIIATFEMAASNITLEVFSPHSTLLYVCNPHTNGMDLLGNFRLHGRLVAINVHVRRRNKPRNDVNTVSL